MCLNYYGLDPAYYITLPNYSWNAFLSLAGVRLQQIHIKEMYEMIEHGLRGGMTQCSFKKVEANNKYMNEDYHKSKPSSYISYLDLNILNIHYYFPILLNYYKYESRWRLDSWMPTFSAKSSTLQ